MVFVQTQLLGYCSRHRLCIAGQHHGAAHTGLFQPGNGLLAGGLDGIRNAQIPGVAAIQRQMHHRACLVYSGDGQAQLFHQAGIACGSGAAIQLSLDAVSAQLLHIGDAGGVQG